MLRKIHSYVKKKKGKERKIQNTEHPTKQSPWTLKSRYCWREQKAEEGIGDYFRLKETPEIT